ncbi:MAG: PAS domain S-box protein [Calditrichaceae bacterium]|nr:PAS domain S-box protein [Calditrichaceae bacterium]MBN2708965.1 PAS domain S-box protein [Calditrichaceae bacterium]RQV97512.1 MAG: PAS domain S-box protein [Calditrichota bacterium]
MKYSSMTKSQLIDEIYKLKQYTLSLSGIKYGVIFQQAADAIFVIDYNGKILEVNDRACQNLGYTTKELLKLNLADLDNSFINIKNKRKILQNKASGQLFTFISAHKRKDGSTFPVEVRIVQVKLNNKKLIIAFTHDITERILTERALRDSEDKFRVLLNSQNDAVFLHPLKSQGFTCFTEVNDVACERYGYTREEFTKLTAVNITKKEDVREHGKTDFRKKLHMQKHLIFETEHIKKSGESFPVEISSNIIQIKDKKYILAVVRDITERKKSEIALLESKEIYKRLAEASFEGVVITKEGKIVLNNNQILNIFGYTSKEFKAIQFKNLFHPDDLNMVNIKMKRNDSGPIEHRGIKKDGSIIHLETRANDIAMNGEVHRQIVIRDITERRKVEEELRLARFCLDQSQIGILQIGEDGEIHYANEYICKKLGYTHEELIKLRIMNIDPLVTEETWKNRKILAAKREFLNFETVYDKKDGGQFPVEIAVSNFEFENRLVSFSFIRDVSERKQLELQLRQSQKMEAVGQLAGGVAHDFNNMLTVINGYCDMILFREPPPELRAPLEQIQSAANRATRLTAQLLAFSRKQIIQPKVLNLNHLIVEQLNMLGRILGEDIKIKTSLDTDLKNIKADTSQVEQCILNIIINARDAMPFGGTLTIETTNIILEEDYAKMQTGTDQLEFIMMAIGDTGVGMDEATRLRIFEPFFTTKGRDRGTGLGLATVYGIVRQNNGFIQVSSEPQKGSLFKIYLPTIDQKLFNDDKPAPDELSFSGKETILLVEDNPAVREVTSSALAGFGYNILTAADGKEALQVFRKHKNKINLLLTDVIMPLMSGKELAEKLHKKDSTLKVLYFSGYTDNSIAHHGVLDEGMEFIQKPYSYIELVKKVKIVLNK